MSGPVCIFEPGQYDAIKEAGQLAGEVLHLAGAMVKPGVTSKEVDDFAEQWIRDQGHIPTFKGYMGFPATLCMSVNENVVHGIPDDKPFKEGDIVSIDVGVTVTEKFNGKDFTYVGDNAFTFPCGKVRPKIARLLYNTNLGLWSGIDALKANCMISDISKAIERVAMDNHYGNVMEFGGHGIGPEYHCDPFIPNFSRYFDSIPDSEILPGMVIAIEPMFNIGVSQVKKMKDKWTIKTADEKPSAHFEHSVLVKADGIDVITNARNTRDILKPLLEEAKA